MLGFSVKWIDNAAHLGGFATGVLAGLLLSQDLTETGRAGGRRRALLLSLVGAVTVTLIILYFPNGTSRSGTALVQIEIADENAAQVFMQSLQQLERKAIQPREAAQRIDEVIVARYDSLLEKLQVMDDDSERWGAEKPVCLQYVRLRRQGWRYLSEAIRDDEIAKEGLALETWDQAMEILATIDQRIRAERPTDLRSEIARLALVETRVIPKFEASLADLENQKRSDAEFADFVETDILAPWRRAEQRFSAKLPQLSPQEQPVGRQVEQYLHHRSRSWQLTIERFREGDEAKASQSQEELERAEELGKQLWGSGDG